MKGVVIDLSVYYDTGCQLICYDFLKQAYFWKNVELIPGMGKKLVKIFSGFKNTLIGQRGGEKNFDLDASNVKACEHLLIYLQDWRNFLEREGVKDFEMSEFPDFFFGIFLLHSLKFDLSFFLDNLVNQFSCFIIYKHYYEFLKFTDELRKKS